MNFDPVYQDELLQKKIKKLYYCSVKGCEILMDKKNKYCADCQTKEVREEVKKNWEMLHPNLTY